MRSITSIKLLFLIFIIAQFSMCDLFLNEQLEENEDKEFVCDEAPEFYVVVEQMPVLIGGLGNLQKQVKYPEMARRAGIEGRVTVQFIVSETGSVICPRVIRGIGVGCNETALEVVKKATFIPGSQFGVPVPVQFSLPIVFSLED